MVKAEGAVSISRLYRRPRLPHFLRVRDMEQLQSNTQEEVDSLRWTTSCKRYYHYMVTGRRSSRLSRRCWKKRRERDLNYGGVIFVAVTWTVLGYIQSNVFDFMLHLLKMASKFVSLQFIRNIVAPTNCRKFLLSGWYLRISTIYYKKMSMIFVKVRINNTL